MKTKKGLKKLLVKKYSLIQHGNCPELCTNKEKTIQLEEYEKSLLIRFKN